MHRQISNLKSGSHFGFYCTDSGTTLDKEFAICTNSLTKVKYMGNTTNMNSHLVRHHPELATEERTSRDANANVSVSQPTINTVFKAKSPSASHRAASINTSIHYLIGKDLRPYSVAEMLHILETRYDILCQKYFTAKDTAALYAETKAKVENALRSADRVALMCDAWTSRATESFVTVTAHFIHEWELQSYALQAQVMSRFRTGANMAEVIWKATVEWKLTGKDPAVGTNNVSNMPAAVELTVYQHIPCFTHVLNLPSQHALKVTAVA